MSSRNLDDLAPRFKPLAIELIALLTAAGILVLIVQTTRTGAEQAINLAKGVSWVQHSKHQDGLAIDVCPFDVYALHGPDKLAWNTLSSDPVWEKMGAIGEKLGLRWGGRWTQKDLVHFEYQDPKTPVSV